MKETLLKDAKELQPKLQEFRRDLHRHPETGFDLKYTVDRLREELKALGYEPKDCGKAGLVVLVGGKKLGKTFLLRADMDALPLPEETGLDYASETPNKMHGCGHDMHATMLLGAAKLLKDREDEIEGTVKLMFQPAEEIFQGARDMIDNGVLENPRPDAAMMIHVAIGAPVPTGMAFVPAPGISMASCEQYHITVKGKGGHGSTPHVAIDPVTAAAYIHIALQEINSREINGHDFGVFTTCKVRAGETSNVIPGVAEMWGTIRTVDPTEEMGAYIRKRIEEISKGVGSALRCEVEVEFFDYCPCVVVDQEVSRCTQQYMTELVGAENVALVKEASNGSEDFAFVSREVPAVNMNLVTGSREDGYLLSVHNPKSSFDDSVLWEGSAAYTYVAMRWLADHRE